MRRDQGLVRKWRRRPKGGRAAFGASSRRAARKPSYRAYSGFRAVRPEDVPGVARQAPLPHQA
ncbi:hypothetical protein, partial [Streptomyces sp. bgisy027]|uniref:hypothetical protein n=1 Tax=Streptomyces sp. bgisy027 TaxID=3413770 RepID=UPI003D72568A